MKRITYLTLVAMCLFSIRSQAQVGLISVNDFNSSDPHWTIDPVISDEFDEPNLDIDTSKWRFYDGCANCTCGLGEFCLADDSDTNIRYEQNGLAHLKILDTDPTAQCTCYNGLSNLNRRYTSSYLYGQNASSFGYYETKIHLPADFDSLQNNQRFNGIAVAFWLFPLAVPPNYNDPYDTSVTDYTWQEIDIFEIQLCNNVPVTCDTRFTWNAHMGKPYNGPIFQPTEDTWSHGDITTGGGHNEKIITFSDDVSSPDYWHTFGADVRENKIVYYFDGQVIDVVDNADVRSKLGILDIADMTTVPKSIILNVRPGDIMNNGYNQFGAAIDFPLGYDTSNDFEMTAEYVRRYYLKMNCSFDYIDSIVDFNLGYAYDVKKSIDISQTTAVRTDPQTGTMAPIYIRAVEDIVLKDDFIVPMGQEFHAIPTPCLN